MGTVLYFRICPGDSRTIACMAAGNFVENDKIFYYVIILYNQWEIINPRT